MAIIALIVTPLVMSIIRKARISADKRSIDAYGRSIELAIAGYLLDTGKFATSIDELTIEYSGDEVVCETTQINPDSSVYLSNCKVNNREVTNYTYGTDKSPSYEAYSVGDEVTYNGVDYYVIKDSGVKDNVVTLLKATSLTTDEVNLYGGVGTANNHVNMHATSDTSANFYQKAFDYTGYGGMQYYSSSTCESYGVVTGCKNDYLSSEVKYVVDAWANARVSIGLQEARLISKNEYEPMIIIETYETPTQPGKRIIPLYDWQETKCSWWTSDVYEDSTDRVWTIGRYSDISNTTIGISSGDFYCVRPVIVLDKSVLSA